jgi:hypothetical protein
LVPRKPKAIDHRLATVALCDHRPGGQAVLAVLSHVVDAQEHAVGGRPDRDRRVGVCTDRVLLGERVAQL